MKKLALTVASVIALTAGVALGSEPAPATSGTPLQVRPSKTLNLQHENAGTPVGYKLLAAAVVVAGAVVWVKKKRGGGVSDRKKRSSIDVLARQSLGVRNELFVVDVEGTRLLVGMTPGSMSTLAVLQTPEGVVGEESALVGEEKYLDSDLVRGSAPSPAPTRDREARCPSWGPGPAAAERVDDKVRSLLGAAPKSHANVRRIHPKAGAVPGQAKGLLLSLQDDDERPITKLGDW